MRVAWLAYAALAACTIAVVRAETGFALAGDSALLLGAELVAGALLLAAALDAQRREPRRRFVAPIVGAALCWPLIEWNSPGAGVVFTAGLALSSAWAPLLAQGALRGPDQLLLGRTGWAAVGAGWLACVGVLGLATAVVSDPRQQGCADCPANRLLVAGNVDAAHTLSQIGLALTAAWAAAFVILAAVRLLRLGPEGARRAMPVLAPAALAIATLGVDAWHGFDRGFLSNDPTDRALFVVRVLALTLTAGGIAWERERARRIRAGVTDLVIELGSSARTGLRDRLAARLGDPSLTVLYALDGDAGWVDEHGRAAEIPAGREITPVIAGDRTLAVLGHSPGVLNDPVLAREVMEGSRLAFEHERLRSLRSAQLEQLQDSRVRIVAAADTERLRLERALHDGAQQSIVALALGVRLAATRETTLASELGVVEDELRTAVEELRKIANGLFPTALAEEGLEAALEVLAEEHPRLVCGAVTRDRFALPVEVAAYFVVAETLERTREGDVDVVVTHNDGVLRLQMTTARKVGQLTSLEDRVGAVGGTIAATGPRLCVELPCAS